MPSRGRASERFSLNLKIYVNSRCFRHLKGCLNQSPYNAVDAKGMGGMLAYFNSVLIVNITYIFFLFIYFFF